MVVGLDRPFDAYMSAILRVCFRRARDELIAYTASDPLYVASRVGSGLQVRVTRSMIC